MKKNDFLPEFVSEDSLVGYLKANAKETFVDEKKHYYTEDEINEMARDSSCSGGEILALDDILKMVKTACSKGSEEGFTLDFPQTSGSEVLIATRRLKDIAVRKGFETQEQTVYGLLDDERESMRYFSADGAEIVERERALSAKEKREFLGMFANMSIQKTGTND